MSGDKIMEIRARAFSMPKIGNLEEEYADAYHLPKYSKNNLFHDDGGKFLFAVADGATEAAFPDVWAKILVRAYGRGYLNIDNFEERIEKLQVLWEKIVNEMDLPWYGREKIQQGSASTFLGIKFTENGMGDKGYGFWEMMSIGDSCVFQIRDDRMVKHYPIKHSDYFNSNPPLLYTIQKLNNSFVDLIECKKRLWFRGDIFYLMTDSISHWFLKEVESGRFPWITLNAIGEGKDRLDFTEFVTYLVDSEAMRNDDATLVRIEIL